ncbi:MAG: hypothetical protein GY855_16800 [candidate division Zixibacteria bacterium]|nr:hypothetical protein [candidate division Zixibacteria bacterium]
MRLTPTIALILLILFGMACSKKKSADPDVVISIEDLLVENNEITGWTYSLTNWVANNYTELLNNINGLAPIYQRHGFVEAAHQSYEGSIGSGTREIQITIYNMDSESNASDTYDDPDVGLSGAIDWADGAGVRAHYVRHGGYQVLTFYSSSYFVYIGLDYDTDESLNIIKQFALNIDGKIQ